MKAFKEWGLLHVEKASWTLKGRHSLSHDEKAKEQEELRLIMTEGARFGVY